MTAAPGHRFDPVTDGRIARLRDELADERIPLLFDGEFGRALLGEIVYARRVPHHESRAPHYGALVFADVPDWDAAPHPPLLVDAAEIDALTARRYADGRSSFTVVTAEGTTALAGFEHGIDDELAAVQLQRTGAVVVQRNERGQVRVVARSGVVVWNGSRWLFKPLADAFVDAILVHAPDAEGPVLTGLLELAVHSLAAARIGATLVWNVDGADVDDDRRGLLGIASGLHGPALSVTRRGHFPAIASALAQADLAVVVGRDGLVGRIGVPLDHTETAAAVVPPFRGARHTSARRFTFDVDGVIVVVVSESGAVTVFVGGDALLPTELEPRREMRAGAVTHARHS